MHVILVKVGEIHLKGQNRPYFENKLIRNMKAALAGMKVRVSIAQSRIYVYDVEESMLEQALERLSRVFGIHALSPAREIEKNMETIFATAVEMMKQAGITSGSFKIKARRADKRFPLESPEIAAQVGEAVLKAFPDMRVDLHKPEHVIEVEVREKAYVYVEQVPAVGGMPVGTNGKAMLLLSGGIDSPVAGYMIAKRGVCVEAVHFHSFPHTSERAKEKVLELAAILARYCGQIKVHVVPFTQLQEAIYEHCPDRTLTVVMRRYMMRIAEAIAVKNGAQALITGESIGQVASQTMESLCCTDAVVSMPVFRPLIGNDKLEIMEIAQRIGTFETSILPYEDCCTVFTPKHPATHPGMDMIQEAEACFNAEEMVRKAIEETETVLVSAKE